MIAQPQIMGEGEESTQQHFHPVTGHPLDVKHMFAYRQLPTIRQFHKCRVEIRGIVGPVGSGKTAGATVELGYRIPVMYHNRYGIDRTVWLILRNTYPMLIDSTQRTFFEWFPPGVFGKYNKQEKMYEMAYMIEGADRKPAQIEVLIMFRSCDRREEVDKFRGYELTGYYIDESDEVAHDVKNILKQRIGRYPRMATWKGVLLKKFPELRKLGAEEFREEIKIHAEIYQTAFGIETTNPPPTESPTYHQFKWMTNVPGPKAEKPPDAHHAGFWQPPYENVANLRPGYYEKLKEIYKNHPDWAKRYIEGKPGVMIRGKNVYNNFSRDIHEAAANLEWAEGKLWRGWDNTGHHPACIVVQMPTPGQIQVLKEFWSDFENIVTFGKRVVAQCNSLFPNASYVDYADPAGWQRFSRKDGSFTSNSALLRDECKVRVRKSEQNFSARINAIESQCREMIWGGEPAFLVDPDCVVTINGFMGGYYYPEIGANSGVFSENPVKNKYADMHDALQYVIIKMRDGSPGDATGGRDQDFGRPGDPLLLC